MGTGDIFVRTGDRPGDQLDAAEGGVLQLMQRYEPFVAVLALVVLFLVVSGDVAGGRFWAEEGKFFFSDFLKLGLGEQLAYLYDGQFQLWTNIAISLAEFSGIGAAPIVTTYVAGALIVGVSAAIYLLRGQLGLSRITAGVLIGFYWMTPQAAELWANATNMQWHMGWLAAVLLAAPAGEQRWTKRSLLVVCGLGGIPACILAPAYFLAAAVERSMERVKQAAILTVALLLQATLVMTAGDEVERNLALDLWTFLQSFIAQTVYAPIVGGDILNAALPGLRATATLSAFVYFGMLVFLAPLLITTRRKRTAVLLVASILTAAIGVWGMVAKEAELAVSGSIHGRYFFASALLNCMTWLIAIESRLASLADRRALVVRGAIAVLALPLFYFHLAASPWRNNFFEGPDWATEVRDLEYNGDRKLEVWPPGWSVDWPADKAPPAP